MLSIQWNGNAIPLFWTFPDKEGNSNGEERWTIVNLTTLRNTS
jgi:hypothetical protein